MSLVNNFGFGPDEFLFYKEQKGGDDIIMSGGYSVDSFLLREGISPMQTFNSLESGSNSNPSQLGGKKASSIFENLAVPTGLFLINQKPLENNYGNSKRKCMDHKMLPDNIFDEFMRMIEIDKSKKKNRKTRRHDIIYNKKTHKAR